MSSHPGGRPDERFPRRAVVSAPAPGGEVPVSVVATVNLTRREGKIEFVNPLPAGRLAGVEPGSEVTLRAVGADGRPIREHPARVGLSSELGPDDDREGLVDAVLPLPAETRAIELAIGGEVVDTVPVGGPPPSLRGVHRVTGGDGGMVRVGLVFDEAMDEGHTYAVQVSRDHGQTWRTVAVGLREPVAEIDRSQFRPGEEVMVRVVATNGLASATVSTDTFRV